MRNACRDARVRLRALDLADGHERVALHAAGHRSRDREADLLPGPARIAGDGNGRRTAVVRVADPLRDRRRAGRVAQARRRAGRVSRLGSGMLAGSRRTVQVRPPSVENPTTLYWSGTVSLMFPSASTDIDPLCEPGPITYPSIAQWLASAQVTTGKPSVPTWAGRVPGRQDAPPSSVTSSTARVRSGPVLSCGSAHLLVVGERHVRGGFGEAPARGRGRAGELRDLAVAGWQRCDRPRVAAGCRRQVNGLVTVVQAAGLSIGAAARSVPVVSGRYRP